MSDGPRAEHPRWWLVDLQNDQRPGNDLVRAPNRRQAIASYRADMIIFYSAHESRRYATARVRALGPIIIDGPLSPEQAFKHALGWAWAWEIARRDRSTVPVDPGSPAPREIAERELGRDLAARIEQETAAAYLGPTGREALRISGLTADSKTREDR